MSFSLSCPRELALLRGLTGGKLSFRFFSLSRSVLVTRSRSKMGNAVLAACDNASRLIFQNLNDSDAKKFDKRHPRKTHSRDLNWPLFRCICLEENSWTPFFLLNYLSYLTRKFLFVALLKGMEEWFDSSRTPAHVLFIKVKIITSSNFVFLYGHFCLKIWQYFISRFFSSCP